MPFSGSSNSGANKHFQVGAQKWVAPETLRATRDAMLQARTAKEGIVGGPKKEKRTERGHDLKSAPTFSRKSAPSHPAVSQDNVAADSDSMPFFSKPSPNAAIESLLRSCLASITLANEWGIYVLNAPNGGSAILIGKSLLNNVSITLVEGSVVLVARSRASTGDLRDELGPGYHELFTR
eukprot:GHVU01066024.1.p1 GENE.GHVU01066024.1~~GHVU01066024.1.p1  ORF type:complete len:201 (+),score=3.88 GHVU01066024.1:64-603(+)